MGLRKRAETQTRDHSDTPQVRVSLEPKPSVAVGESKESSGDSEAHLEIDASRKGEGRKGVAKKIVTKSRPPFKGLMRPLT